VTQDKIVFPATQSSITAIASDYASIAGGHPTIGVFDEIGAATSERARRLWDELVPVPTRTISCRLVVTRAGFEGEGHLMQDLHKRGLQLPEVHFQPAP
jgi:phage terminase large subunit-like protein